MCPGTVVMADLPMLSGPHSDFQPDSVPAPGMLASCLLKAEGSSSQVETQ